jgi:hypothetical protein
MNFNTIRILINVDKKDIVYLNSIIDSYEGLAIMRTVDRKNGNVVVFTTEKNEATVIELLNSLKQEGVLLDIITKEKNELLDKWI